MSTPITLAGNQGGCDLLENTVFETRHHHAPPGH